MKKISCIIPIYNVENYIEKCIMSIENQYTDDIEIIDGKIKEKGTYAKMARGSLIRYMAEHQIENPEEMKQFDGLGYKYKEEYSDNTKWIFCK